METLLGLEQGQGGFQRIVEVAHRHLRLDLVCVGEVGDGDMTFRATAGCAGSFGVHLGAARPAAGSYVQLLLDGLIPSVVADTAANPHTAPLPVTKAARIGAFIGVPLRRSDGSLYGALLGANHEPDHTLDERDVRFLTMLSELIRPELDEQRRKEDLRVEIARIIETEDALVAYQPIVDVRSRRCLGVEALARFPQPFARPDETFASAYDVGLGFDLERMIVQRTWSLLDELRADQFLTVNLTPGALLKLAPRASMRDDICLSNLVVEMTEHSTVDSYAALREELEPLRERGLRIAIDDAGAGYASLRHVVEIRPDFIKIDRSLIHGVADDRARRVAVGAFVLLALDLEATVVAEGVERAQDFAALSDLGVNAAQGYLLAKPSTNRRDLLRWLNLPRSTSGVNGSVGVADECRGVPSPLLVEAQAQTIAGEVPVADPLLASRTANYP